MGNRQSLHELVDALPESELDAARQVLENLRFNTVAVDEDVLSPEELNEIEEARAEIRKGEWVTLDQIKSENGL